MAWVFLTDSRAYKLKKPVRYDFLDYSTVEARRNNCLEEVRLNRRLAPDVYLAVVPLTMGPQGDLHIDLEGEIVDWMVCMRRLPDDRMLDRAIADQTISEEDLRKVGSLLAGFYRKALPVEITPSEYRRRLREDIQANRQELARPEYGLSIDLIDAITAQQLKFLDEEKELLDARVLEGRVIEAHGDLRPEHICLEKQPVIIDCLEFNRDFRILDTASELSFLSMECERLGAPQAGELILETCGNESGDAPPERLLTFYKSYHACLRAKIAVWHLRDHEVRDHKKWIDKAKHYLALASCIVQARRSTIDPPS